MVKKTNNDDVESVEETVKEEVVEVSEEDKAKIEDFKALLQAAWNNISESIISQRLDRMITQHDLVSIVLQEINDTVIPIDQQVSLAKEVFPATHYSY